MFPGMSALSLLRLLPTADRCFWLLFRTPDPGWVRAVVICDIYVTQRDPATCIGPRRIRLNSLLPVRRSGVAPPDFHYRPDISRHCAFRCADRRKHYI